MDNDIYLCDKLTKRKADKALVMFYMMHTMNSFQANY